MKTSWLLAPVLLSAMTVTQDVSTDRLDAALSPLAATLTDASAQRALQDWQEAHRRVMAKGVAEELVEAGDVLRRLGEAHGTPASFDDQAREIYDTALLRARRQESLHGVLRVAEAFAELGDRAAVARALGIARNLAAHDPEGRADVQAVAARIAVDFAEDPTRPGP
jgi:hypothetical protein